jgi:ADP-ribose pyrophosphatase
MSDFDEDAALAHYLELGRRRPELFANPEGQIYEILAERGEIAAAREAARRERGSQGLPAEDTRVGVLSEDPYLLALRDAVRFPDGGLGLYNRLVVPPGVAILPLLGERIVLIHRFRHGTRGFHYEIPRGMAAHPGDPAEDARRELEEEIGTAPRELVPLGRMHPSSGVVNESITLFLARVDRLGRPDRHEAIATLEAYPVAEVERMVDDGRLSDGPSLAAILRARLRGLV